MSQCSLSPCSLCVCSSSIVSGVLTNPQRLNSTRLALLLLSLPSCDPGRWEISIWASAKTTEKLLDLPSPHISVFFSDLLTGGSPSAASASSDVEILLLVAGLSPAARFVADLNHKRVTHLIEDILG